MKKHSKSSQRSEPTLKRTKARGPVQRDVKEVLAEVLGKLTGKLDAPAVSTSGRENRRGNTVGPNRDRLTVGVDLGDRWSQYCILGLEGETLAEGQLRTMQEDVRAFFQAMATARVVVEVGTHSAWVQDVITECGHEVLVANPRLMEGSKRRKRKSDRIDANKLARLGRVDPQSLYPTRHHVHAPDSLCAAAFSLGQAPSLELSPSFPGNILRILRPSSPGVKGFRISDTS